jgi:hypothetical protein
MFVHSSSDVSARPKTNAERTRAASMMVSRKHPRWCSLVLHDDVGLPLEHDTAVEGGDVGAVLSHLTEAPGQVTRSAAEGRPCTTTQVKNPGQRIREGEANTVSPGFLAHDFHGNDNHRAQRKLH